MFDVSVALVQTVIGFTVLIVALALGSCACYYQRDAKVESKAAFLALCFVVPVFVVYLGAAILCVVITIMFLTGMLHGDPFWPSQALLKPLTLLRSLF